MIDDNFIEMSLESQEKVNGGAIPPVIAVAYAAMPAVGIAKLFYNIRKKG